MSKANFKIDSESDFKGYLQTIYDDLRHAAIHWLLFEEINKASKLKATAFNYSPFFWRFTRQAHIEVVIFRLCRVYDQHSDGFHLHRLVQIVHDNLKFFSIENLRNRIRILPNIEEEIKKIGIVDQKQLSLDLILTSRQDALVEKLKHWRDKVLVHKDSEFISGRKHLEKIDPLQFADLKTLLDRGFEILNRYSRHFDAAMFILGAFGGDDFHFVVEALEHHPRFIEQQKWDEFYKKRP